MIQCIAFVTNIPIDTNLFSVAKDNQFAVAQEVNEKLIENNLKLEKKMEIKSNDG